MSESDLNLLGLPPPSGPAGRDPAPLTEWEMRLLAIISSFSNFTACRASNAKLAEELGRSPRTVERLLESLEKKQRILRVTSPFSRSFNAKKRTIYIVSSKSPLEGARELVRQCRRNGKTTNRKRDELCGWLACTPEQLDTWVAEAERLGWMQVERSFGKYVLTRTATAPFYQEWCRLPRDQRPKYEDLPQAENLQRKIFVYFSNLMNASKTDEEAAAHLGSTRDSVRVTLRKAVKAKKLFVRRHEGKRCVAQTEALVDSLCPDVGLQALRAVLGEEHFVSAAKVAAKLDEVLGTVDRRKKLIRKAKDQKLLYAAEVKGTWFYSAKPFAESDLPTLLEMREDVLLGVADQDEVSKHVDRLLRQENLIGIFDSSVPALAGIRWPYLGMKMLREAARARPRGEDPVEHAARFIVDNWLAQNQESVGLYRQVQLRAAKIAETRQILSELGVVEDDDHRIWMVVDDGGTRDCRAAAEVIARRLQQAEAIRSAGAGGSPPGLASNL